MREASSRMSLANKGARRYFPYIDVPIRNTAAGSAWIEARFADYQSQLVKHSVHRRSELSRPCGGNHFAGLLARTMGHRPPFGVARVRDWRAGLGQEHPLRGARHIALRHHGVEHAKKVSDRSSIYSYSAF